MRKSLGDKRKEIADEQIARDHRASTATSTEDERVKIFRNEEFGFQRITVERPLRLRWEVDEAARAARGLARLAEARRRRRAARPSAPIARLALARGSTA